MRKVTQNAVNAFMCNSPFAQGNTTVTVVKGKTQLFLHGNLIAERNSKGAISITNAGWFSNTTKERLNGVLNMVGIRLQQKKRTWYLIGDIPKGPVRQWDGKMIKIFKPVNPM